MSRLAGRLALVVLALGCTDEPAPGPTRPDQRAGCLTSGDCRGGLACLRGACVAPEAPLGTFALRVVPPQDLTTATVEVPNLRFEDGPVLAPELPLLLPERAVLVGRAITTDEPPREVAVRALAVLRDSVATEGRTVAGTAVVTPRGPRFTFNLAPCWPDFSGTCKDTVFTIRLTPEAGLLPPAEFPNVVTRDNRPEEERPFALPGPLESPELPGTVRLLDGTPLHDLTVYGVDAGGLRVTTESVTDLDGSFRVRYWPHYGGHTIRLLATSKDPTRPLPVLGLAVALPEAGAEPAPAQLVVPDIGSTFTARGTLEAPDGSPVGGAHVRFTTELDAGRFSADALSAADGSFNVTLYPGTYLVDVEPVLGSGLRIQRTRVEAWSDGPSLDLRLKSLVPVHGRIVWPDGAPLAATRLESRLLAVASGHPGVESPVGTPPTRLVQGETDEEGVFTLLLDPGEQSLTITPIAGLGLPTTRHRFRVPVESGLAVDLGDVPVLPAAVVALTVQDLSELPVSGAVVQVWRTDLEAGPEKVAEGTTDAVGGVVLRLPAENGE